MDILSNLCEQVEFLEVFYIIKIVMNLITILVPIILIVMIIVRFVNTIVKGDDPPLLKDIAQKFVAAVLIFLVPTIVNVVLSLNNTDSIVDSSCWESATRKNIDALKIVKKAEEEKLLNEFNSYLEKLRADALKKEEEMREQIKNAQKNEGSNSSATGADGYKVTYNSQTKTFYIPNKRATSDSHTSINKGNGPSGINSIFGEMLRNLMADAKKKGYTITVSSGYRSYDAQLRTWNNSHRACSVRTSWVACPGGSRHGWGIAADLVFNGRNVTQYNYKSNPAAVWVHSNAAKYGLTFRLSNEPWHIEPMNVVGGNYGSCTVPC